MKVERSEVLNFRVLENVQGARFMVGVASPTDELVAA
jgi:hypothetical protein